MVLNVFGVVWVCCMGYIVCLFNVGVCLDWICLFGLGLFVCWSWLGVCMCYYVFTL